MLADKQHRETEEMKAKAQISNAQPDDLIDFYHLKSRKVMYIGSFCLPHVVKLGRKLMCLVVFVFSSFHNKLSNV